MGSPSATCYPQPRKAKALAVCRAFAEGCGGQVAENFIPARLQGGAAVFYGVRPPWKHLWQQAKEERRDWYYVDNGFLPAGGRFYRVAWNRLQSAQMPPDPSRLAAHGVEVRAMRPGRALLVALQSEEFLATLAPPGAAQSLMTRAAALAEERGLSLRVRAKDCPRPLESDLSDAGLVVTWSSNVAVLAALAGIEAMALGESVVAELADWSVESRRDWAARLAASQWTLDEMRSGRCWRDLQGA